jgi:hypothetical protein
LDLIGGNEMLEGDSSIMQSSQKPLNSSKMSSSRQPRRKESNKHTAVGSNPFEALFSNSRKDSKFQSTDPRRRGASKRSINGMLRPPASYGAAAGGLHSKKSSSLSGGQANSSIKSQSKFSKQSENFYDEEKDKYYSGDDEEGEGGRHSEEMGDEEQAEGFK